jgi:hypothetical protein
VSSCNLNDSRKETCTREIHCADLHLFQMCMLLCLWLEVPEYKCYKAPFWCLCPEVKIRPRKHKTINVSSPCSGAFTLLQQQIVENCFILDSHKPQCSKAYPALRKKCEDCEIPGSPSGVGSVWDMMWRLVCYRRFGETCFLNLQDLQSKSLLGLTGSWIFNNAL